MKKLSIILMLVITVITFFACMKDSPSEPPTGILQITTPLANHNIAVGDTVPVLVNPIMLNISKVEFYIDGALKEIKLSSPYNYNWVTSGETLGSHMLKAISYGEDGKLEQQIAINLVEGLPPVVTILTPAVGSSFEIGTNCNITATATDPDGTVAEVRFYIDDVLKSTDTVTPYSYDWNTTGYAAGNQHTIKIIAKDNRGKVGEKSIPVTLFVNQPPTITISGLTDVSSIQYGTTKTVTAEATDSDGTIAEVRFYVDNVLKATDTTAPYSYNWNTTGLPANQQHTFKAIAKDNGGLESEKSLTVTITKTLEPMCFVQGGTLNTGSTPVTISAFYIGNYEVTQTQWLEVMGTNPSYFTGNLYRPVEQVSWYNALVFCNKKSILDGLTPCYSINGSTDPALWGSVPTANADSIWDAAICNWTAKGYRLPTSSEWEFAAKGGNYTHGYLYSGSNTIGDVAWYKDNSGNITHTVGTQTPNELGLYDMSGNVMEFCWQDPATVKNTARSLASRTSHIAQGGCYFGDFISCALGGITNYTGFGSSSGLRLVRIP